MPNKKQEKELEEEIEKLIDDDNTIEDYSKTLKDVEENFKSRGEDLETGMFILLKVAELKTLQERNAEVKQAIRKLKVYSIKDKKGNVRDCILVEELLQKLGLEE